MSCSESMLRRMLLTAAILKLDTNIEVPSVNFPFNFNSYAFNSLNIKENNKVSDLIMSPWHTWKYKQYLGTGHGGYNYYDTCMH